MRVFPYKILCLAVFSSSCEDDRNGMVVSESDVVETPEGSTDPYELEIRDLASKAESGDSQAAYQLYELFTYSNHRKDYGLAFYWAVRAKELNHPLADNTLIETAKNNVIAVFLHDHEADKSIEVTPGLLPE